MHVSPPWYKMRMLVLELSNRLKGYEAGKETRAVYRYLNVGAGARGGSESKHSFKSASIRVCSRLIVE